MKHTVTSQRVYHDTWIPCHVRQRVLASEGAMTESHMALFEVFCRTVAGHGFKMHVLADKSSRSQSRPNRGASGDISYNSTWPPG